MFQIFVFGIGCVLISAVCSLVEAALYAVQPMRLKVLADGGSTAAKTLMTLRKNIGRPVSAILVVNTTVTAAGGTVLGFLSSEVFGQFGATVVAVTFSCTILVLGEIIPKIVGVNYALPVALVFALPLKISCAVLWPVVVLAELFSKKLGGDKVERISHEEVLTVAKMGREAGGIDQLESTIIRNVISMDSVLVKSVVTPRLNVFRLPEDCLIKDAIATVGEQQFTRIPIHRSDDRDDVKSYVMQGDIYRAFLANQGEKPLSNLARDLRIVPDLMRADKLFLSMMDRHDHMVAAVDEYGSFAGVVTLEDLLEQVVGREIADETDAAKLGTTGA